jgi:integrase
LLCPDSDTPVLVWGSDWGSLDSFGVVIGVILGKLIALTPITSINSNTARQKASKGSVQIKVSNSRLQLVFSHAGKRHYLSLGFSDTTEARALAEMKASQIRMDMISGHFDETLAKYKPEPILPTVAVTPISTPENPSLAELWERFVEYKRPQCSENTMMFVYGHFTKYLHKLPTRDLGNVKSA